MTDTSLPSSYPLATPLALVQRHQRHHQISASRPLDAAHSHVDRAALRQDLLQPVLANVAILDGVGGDEGGETAGAQQAVNTPDEIGDQIAQARRGEFPFHIFAESVAVGAAQRLPPRYGGFPRMQSNPPRPTISGNSRNQ